jgi:glycosyltransferase 2 family protein
MKKKLTTALKIALSALLIFWLFRKLDWHSVAYELRDINYFYLVLFIILQLAAMVISAKKWQVIAAFQGIHFTIKEGFQVYLTGTFINNFLPSTIGGDIYRSLWLAPRAANKSTAFSTVVFDRFLGLFVTATLALIGGIFVWQAAGIFPFFLTMSYLGLWIFLCLFLIILFFASRFKNLVSFLTLIRWEKLQNFIRVSLSYSGLALWREGIWWTLCFAFVGLGLSNYVLFLALGYTLPFMAFLGLVFMMALYVSLPISISNIGVKEWAYGVLFVVLGVSFEAAVTVALLSRFLQTGISLLALPIYLKDKSTHW